MGRDTRVDEHVAHEQGGLDVIVGLVSACGVEGVRVGVGGDGVVVRVGTCDQRGGVCGDDGGDDGFGLGGGARISCYAAVIVRVGRGEVVSCGLGGGGDAVIVGGHLGNGELVGLFTDVLTWWVERGGNGGGTLSDNTDDASCGVGKVEGGP